MFRKGFYDIPGQNVPVNVEPLFLDRVGVLLDSVE